MVARSRASRGCAWRAGEMRKARIYRGSPCLSVCERADDACEWAMHTCTCVSLVRADGRKTGANGRMFALCEWVRGRTLIFGSSDRSEGVDRTMTVSFARFKSGVCEDRTCTTDKSQLIGMGRPPPGRLESKIFHLEKENCAPICAGSVDLQGRLGCEALGLLALGRKQEGPSDSPSRTPRHLTASAVEE